MSKQSYDSGWKNMITKSTYIELIKTVFPRH